MAVAIATNVRKELSGVVLFDGVSFKIEPGERLVLSGPNGTGKTTLLRIPSGDAQRGNPRNPTQRSKKRKPPRVLRAQFTSVV